MIVNQPKIEARVFRSVEELEALRSSWDSWPTHRDSDFDFYLTVLRAYPEIVRPHVVGLYRDGELISILVGRLDQKKIVFEIGYLKAFKLMSRCLTFVYEPIHGDSSPDVVQRLLEEVVRCLRRGEGDLATLEYVSTESPLYALGLKIPGFFSSDFSPSLLGHNALLIPSNVDEIYGRMSSSRRKHLRADAKKLTAHALGPARIICYRREHELNALFMNAEEVAKKTYQRGLQAGFADTADVRMRLETAARKGWLRAYLLFLGDRPIAFWIGMLYGDSFLSEYMGYDPEFRSLSPGLYLLLQVIAGFCGRIDGDIVRELDFGLGGADYKTMLSTRSWQEARVFIFSPTAKGMMLKFMRAITQFADSNARRILAFVNQQRRLKRAWRDRVASPPRRKISSSARMLEAETGNPKE